MKADWSHLDKFRRRDGEFRTPDRLRAGAFQIPCSGLNARGLIVIASSAEIAAEEGLEPWDHVSVRAHDPVFKKDFIPTWQAMCYVKELFWDDTECVVQYHVPKSDYVNTHDCVLHLWRCPTIEFPMPPKDFV